MARKGRPSSWDEYQPLQEDVGGAPPQAPPGPGAALWVAVVVLALVGGVIGGTVVSYLRGTPSPAGGDGQGNTVTFVLDARLLSGFTGAEGAIAGRRNPDLNVTVGTTVVIIVRNPDTMAHNLLVEGYNVQTTMLSPRGGSDTITFVASQEGAFAYYCTVPGHRFTMEGRLVVGSGTGGGVTRPPIGPAKETDVPSVSRNPWNLPGPLGRNTSATVDLFLDVRELTSVIQTVNESGMLHPATFTYWTYNGTVPGPFFRVRVGDTIVVHFSNSGTMEHSVDFHAVTGPGGGAGVLRAGPGGSAQLTFKALNPGVFVYHCASPHIPTHISLGMYGLILVEPAGGLPPVDKEFYVMQGDIYTKWPAGEVGHQEQDDAAMLEENPTFVVFNGAFQALTGTRALTADRNDTIRIFFGVGGPNLVSSFHIIGEIFDRVYNQGDVLSPPLQSVQTTLVPPGGAIIVELYLDVPGDYILVDHSLVRAIDKGAVGILTVSGPPNPDVYNP